MSVTDVTSTSVKFAWSAGASSTQDKYQYQYQDVTAGSNFIDLIDVDSGTEVTVSGLSAGHLYQFQVFAVSGNTLSDVAYTTDRTSKTIIILCNYVLVC